MTSPTPPGASPAPHEIPLYQQPEIHDRRWFLLGIMCLSLVMVVMAVSGLNVAIPSIQRSLEATPSDIQWIIDSYAIIFAGLLLSAGAIGDRFGRKRALQGGLILFGIGSAMGVAASSVGPVILARAVMGIGAAFIMPATLSIVSAVFPPEERGKAIAVWAGFAGAGGALGPLIVGFFLTDWWVFPAYWWGAAFLINVVAVVAVFAAVSTFAPHSKDAEATPLDPVGSVLSMVGLAALLYGIIEGPAKGWTSPEVLAGFVIGLIGLGGFVMWEHRAAHPMLPMKFFRNGGFSIGSGVITFAFFVMFGFFFLITQFLQFVRDYSPLDAGVATLPLAATLILVSPRSSALADRIGAAKVMSTGFAFLAAGYLGLTQVDASSPYVALVGCFILIGIGMGITVAPATGSIMAAVPMNKAGVGSAVNDTTREVGGALGIAVLGSIANAAYRGSISGEAIDALPAETAATASASISDALRELPNLPPELGGALLGEAKDAFVTAFHTSIGTAAAIAAVLAIVVRIAGRRADATASPEPSPVATAETEPATSEAVAQEP